MNIVAVPAAPELALHDYSGRNLIWPVELVPSLAEALIPPPWAHMIPAGMPSEIALAAVEIGLEKAKMGLLETTGPIRGDTDPGD